MKKWILILLFIAKGAWGNIILHYQVTEGTNPKGPMIFFLHPEFFKIRQIQQGKTTEFIFNAREKKLFTVSFDKKEYHEITQADFKKIGERLDQVQLQMEEQIKKLPPERQKMMRAMMGKIKKNILKNPKDQMDKIKYSFKLAKKNVKVLNRKTDLYVGIRPHKKMEIWSALEKELSLKSENFNAFIKFGDFMGELKKSLPKIGLNMAGLNFEDTLKNIPGFPVQIKRYKDGQMRELSMLQKVEYKSLSARDFSPPKGHKRIRPMDTLKN